MNEDSVRDPLKMKLMVALLRTLEVGKCIAKTRSHFLPL